MPARGSRARRARLLLDVLEERGRQAVRVVALVGVPARVGGALDDEEGGEDGEDDCTSARSQSWATVSRRERGRDAPMPMMTTMPSAKSLLVGEKMLPPLRFSELLAAAAGEDAEAREAARAFADERAGDDGGAVEGVRSNEALLDSSAVLSAEVVAEEAVSTVEEVVVLDAPTTELEVEGATRERAGTTDTEVALLVAARASVALTLTGSAVVAAGDARLMTALVRAASTAAREAA